MISLAGSLPLDWPPVLEDVFAWFDVMSSAGSNLLIPDCELSEMRTADVFYIKQIFYTCIPPIVTVLCLCTWLSIWKCCHPCRQHPQIKKPSSELDNHENGNVLALSNMTWPWIKDFSILSIVLILFLCYPLLAKLALSALKCPYIGHRAYLLADLQELCFEGRHLSYFLLLTVPQIIIYVIGLPLAATCLILRSGSNLLHKSKRMHMRYSLLYVGYVKGREWCVFVCS